MPGVPPCTTDHPSGLIDDPDDSDGEDLPPLHVQGQGGVGNPSVVTQLPAVGPVIPAQPVNAPGVLYDAPAPAQPPSDEFTTPPASPPPSGIRPPWMS